MITMMSCAFNMKFRFLFVIVFLVLALTACEEGEPAPVTRSLEKVVPAIPPVEPEQAEPAPTALAPAWSGRLTTGSTRPLHGSPPYTASLSATFNAFPAGLPAACERLVWTFGDGTEAVEPCAMTMDSPSTTWYTNHRYEQPGIYHARARVELADGASIESERSQTIMVATPQRHRWRQP